jgi:hypothetical protein
MPKLNYAIVMPLIPANAGVVWIENSAETAFVSLNNAQVYENLNDTGASSWLPNESEIAGEATRRVTSPKDSQVMSC